MVNSNSLANLKPGGKPHRRKNEVSAATIIDLVRVLNTNEKDFKHRLSNLSDKDYCDMYLKMLKLVLPKNINLNVDEKPVMPVWEIIPASVATARERE